MDRMLWAIDPFEEKNRLRQTTAEVLRVFTRRNHAKVEPVFVLSARQLDLKSEHSPAWVRKYKPAALRSLQEITSRLQVENAEAPKVLLRAQAPTRDAARAVATYAKTEKAGIIAVSSHGRHGLKRLFAGSFAESLLLQSEIPVLINGPEVRQIAKLDTKLDKVLFATALGPSAEKTLKRLLPIARELGAELTILHCLPNPPEAVLQSGVYLLGGGWIPLGMYLKDESLEAKKRAQRLATTAGKAGVRTRIRIETAVRGKARTILDAAEQGGYGMLVMAAESSAVEATVLGSLTRSVIRHSPCPALVIRTR
jgi:nucleotide-binding universal stress UspA family protein